MGKNVILGYTHYFKLVITFENAKMFLERIKENGMIRKSTLRWLVVLEIILGFGGILIEKLGEFDGTFWSKDISLPANSVFGGMMTWPQFITSIVLIFIGLIAYVGILRFWRPARGLYILFHILQLVTTPLFGPYCGTGWGYIFKGASFIITGIIFTIIYFTPVKEHFKKETLQPMANI
jgi:hypothetical protein